MVQYDRDSDEVQSVGTGQISAIVAESIALALTLATLTAEAVIEARERRLDAERANSEERARLNVEHLRAQRAAAEPLLRAVHQERFWRSLDVGREEDRRRLGLAWQAASEWAGGDPYAAHTLDVMRERLKKDYGLEVPSWPVGGAELARMVTVADPAYRKLLEKARSALGAGPEAGTSYAILIRNVNEPYGVVHRSEMTAPAGVGAEEVAARAFVVWDGTDSAAGAGPFVVEVMENTGAEPGSQVPAAVLRSEQVQEVLEAAEARQRALVDGSETGSPAELLRALGGELDRLEEEEKQRGTRREEYADRLKDADLSPADRTRLEGNIAAIDAGLPVLHQQQADTALRVAATAAEVRGENPRHVHEAARLSDSLDDGWWQTASAGEIAGVWEHVGQWEAGQARTEMQDTLRQAIEKQHRLLIPRDATPEMVSALFGGREMPGPAVPITGLGAQLRDQAQGHFEDAFEDFSRATRLADEARQQHAGTRYGEELDKTASELIERAEQRGQQGTRLLDQGTWLDRQSAETVGALYRDNSAEAVIALAAEFEARWGRPLSPAAADLLPQAVQEQADSVKPWVVTVGKGSTEPVSITSVPSQFVQRSAGVPEAETTAQASTGQSESGPVASGVGEVMGQVAAPGAKAVEWLSSAAEAATDDGAVERSEARRESGLAALDTVADEEAAEAIRLTERSFPEGAEAATAQAPDSRRAGTAPEVPGRQRTSELGR
ncbi:hypothetical protein [Streptomyces sp. NPDC047525]|uniref:hypothetical protein n=1 Tax=Streptomyces sp. NPDC047525 TaxID=3155264 RepID=UPI0033D17B42